LVIPCAPGHDEARPLERPGVGKPKQKQLARDVHGCFLHSSPKTGKHFALIDQLAARGAIFDLDVQKSGSTVSRDRGLGASNAPETTPIGRETALARAVLA
jgi:hypothetical protein